MLQNKLHLLSTIKIKSIKPKSKDFLVNDGGGLYLKVRPHETKEWIFRYSSPISGKRRKQTLGNFSDMPLTEARQLASDNRNLISKGVDPLTLSEANREKQRNGIAEKEALKAMSVSIIFDQWKKEDLQNRKDKGSSAEALFKKDVFPVIGDKPISEITREDIKNVLDRPKNRKSNRIANILLSELKQFFGYADDEELIIQDPTRRLRKSRVGGIERPRKRVLSEDELKILKEKLDSSGLLQVYKHAICFYLATACRRSEVILSPLSNIDINKRNFYIPPDKSKNTDAHNIYLSDFAIKQVLAIKSRTGSHKWLLPNPKDDNPISQPVITKQITDRQPRREKDGKKAKKLQGRANDNSLELPNGHWITHDLRRTAATIMQQLGIFPHVIKKCLNQRVGDMIEETYQRAQLINEQRDAFEKLGAYLEKIFD